MVRIGRVKGRSSRSWTLLTVLITLSMIVAGISLGGATTGADRGGTQQATPIDSCTTIDEPGTYRLTDSIENSTADVCINIRTSDVHFDGGSHTVDGNISRQAILDILPPAGPAPTDGMGIGVNLNGSSPVSNVTIVNVTATDWFYGVSVRGVAGVTVRGITSTTSGIGILVDATTDASVERSNGSNNVITGVYISRSADRSANNTVANTTTSENGRYGVLLFDSPNSTVRNVTATGNEFVGLEVINSSDSTIRNVTATENEFRGFGVDALPGDVARNVTVADNDFSRNGYIGMAVFATTNSTFSNNSVAGTQGTLPPDRSPPVPSAGFVVDFGSAENIFVDIDARDQAEWSYVAVNSGTNAVENLQTDAATVSFEGRNVALGATATVSENATGGEDAMLAGGVTVTNTSADPFIDLQVQWENGQSEDQPSTETASTTTSLRKSAQIGIPDIAS